jgi:nitroreductase
MDIFEAPSEALPAAAASSEEIARFVTGAGAQAPSVHNTQPWRFYHGDHEISIAANNERQLLVADPHGREMMISCGAALFNVRVALRYLGFVPKTRVLPDPELPNLIARVTWDEQVPPIEYEKRLFAEIARRRTHRGGFDPARLPAALLDALPQEATREKATLTLVTGNEHLTSAIAAVVEAGDCVLRLNVARAKEEAHWAPGPGSHRQDGVPPTAYPAQPEHTQPDFATRDFAHGHGWGLPPRSETPPVRSAGVIGLLTTSVDQPSDWVHAGQALQRVLLTASSCHVAAALHSQPLEIPLLREFIRVELAGHAYPQMVLRLGATSEEGASVRLPVEAVLSKLLI